MNQKTLSVLACGIALVSLAVAATSLALLWNREKKLDRANESIARIRVRVLTEACSRFENDTGRRVRDLGELVTRPKDVTEEQWSISFVAPGVEEVDPWGNPYRLEYAKGGVVVLSNGPDGIPNTEDDLDPRRKKKRTTNLLAVRAIGSASIARIIGPNLNRCPTSTVAGAITVWLPCSEPVLGTTLEHCG